MSHPSEWTKFFDENAGRYRYKHKGSGLIRDTLMAIGKAFKGTAKNVVKTAVENLQKQSLKKRGRKLVKLLSKGSKQIQQIVRKRKPKQQLVSQDAKKKLANILQNQVPKKTCFICRLVEIKSNFGKRNLIAEKFFPLV